MCAASPLLLPEARINPDLRCSSQHRCFSHMWIDEFPEKRAFAAINAVRPYVQSRVSAASRGSALRAACW